MIAINIVLKLLRTKVTGPGKRVRELVVFIPVGTGVFDAEWLPVGYALWRSVAVEGLDDAKIDEYLDKQGIKSMTDQGAAGSPRRQGAGCAGGLP